MIDLLGNEGQSLAIWIQSVSNVLVLFFIYRQLDGFRLQLAQTETQARAERSWQFMNFYQDEMSRFGAAAYELRPAASEPPGDGPAPGLHVSEQWHEAFRTRTRVFSLLNQLIRFQQVDERLLYSFLNEEFLEFVNEGTRVLGRLKFADEVSPRILFLVATWGGAERISGSAAESKPAPAKTAAAEGVET